MDRNSIIGFILLMLLGGGYIFWTNHERNSYYEQKRADSIAAVQRGGVLPKDSLQSFNASGSDTNHLVLTDSNALVQNDAFRKEVSYETLENSLLKLTFSSKGGFPIKAQVKNFKTYGGDSLIYFDGDANFLSFDLPTQEGITPSRELYFSAELSSLPDGGQVLTMTSLPEPGKKVQLTYSLPKDDYMMTVGLSLQGFGKRLAGQKTLRMDWATQPLKTEKDMENERFYMQNHYEFTTGSTDYERLSSKSEVTLKKPVKWFAVRSHFFNSTLIAQENFGKGSFEVKKDEGDDSSVIVLNTNHLDIPILNAGGNEYNLGFQWLISPNDYHLLKDYGLGLDEMISLGYGPFFFVKYISKWFIIPLFDFLNNQVASVGIVIILLIFIIRLLLSFFSYKSYMSNAKMRALKPELEALKEKYGGDQQKMGMEQMKLYRTAGVNPLGGCLPMLLQMPFLLAVYYFIPTALELRQVPFLWAEDLSTYDAIFGLPFKIPFYGAHVSLFTLLMTATSLFLALYNKNMMGGGAAAPSGGTGADMQKMMKYMPYLMPIMFLGWFNSMAAGLTLYYTCSNLLSLIQQGVIQKYFINEEAIRAKIQAKKKEPASASKWQKRLEEMQKAQLDRVKNKK